MNITGELALKAILVVAVAGLLFSGYLSYNELFLGATSCNAAAPALTAIAGLPVCVYGFVMYLLVLAIAIVGLRSRK